MPTTSILQGTPLLIFPDAQLYSIYDVFNFLVVAKYPCIHASAPDTPHPLGATVDSTQTGDASNYGSSIQLVEISMAEAAREREHHNACPQCSEGRSSETSYLADRLLEAVEGNKFEVFDHKRRAIPPPVNHYTQDPVARSKLPKSSRNNPRSAYTSVESWALSAHIYKSDLIDFCNAEKISFKFEEELTQSSEAGFSTAESGNSESELDPSYAASSITEADYIKLAMAFPFMRDKDDNLKWFRSRCRNYSRYRAFKEALCTKGKRGNRTPSTFNVLAIAAFLEKKMPLWQIRIGIQKEFPLLLDQFDDVFGTKDPD